jgi:uncharacterized protein YjdB
MRATALSRTLAALGTLALAGACTDGTSPDFSPGLLPVGQMTIVPSSATIRPGQAVQLSVQIIRSSGGDPEGGAVSWASSNEAVASVSDGGQVFGLSEGHAVITARTQRNAQIARIHVLPRLKPNMEPAPR